jgi:hypothetical protein
VSWTLRRAASLATTVKPYSDALFVDSGSGLRGRTTTVTLTVSPGATSPTTVAPLGSLRSEPGTVTRSCAMRATSNSRLGEERISGFTG